jgi:hypothetical protein
MMRAIRRGWITDQKRMAQDTPEVSWNIGGVSEAAQENGAALKAQMAAILQEIRAA